MFEGLRRLLIVFAWLPTIAVLLAAISDLDSLLNRPGEGLSIIGWCALISFVVHRVLNWIFQFREHYLEKDLPDIDSEQNNNRPLTVEAYMAKRSNWFYLIGMGWFIAMIWFGNSRNNFPTPYWGMWSSIDAFSEYWKLTWFYFVVGLAGFFLLMIVVEGNYRRMLKRNGYLR